MTTRIRQKVGHWGRRLGVTFLILGLALGAAHATDKKEMVEAWQRKEHAILKYRTALKAIDKPTAEDKARLRKEILDPAYKDYKASHQGLIKTGFEKLRDGIIKFNEKNNQSYVRRFASLFSGGKSGQTGPTAPTGAGSKAKIDRADRKNVTVEGEIIEEMQFGAGEAKAQGDEAEMVFSGKKLKRAERKNVVVDPKDSEDMEFGGKAPKKP